MFEFSNSTWPGFMLLRTCKAGSVMPRGGSWVVASITPVTSKLGQATMTKGHRQLVAGPAKKHAYDTCLAVSAWLLGA